MSKHRRIHPRFTEQELTLVSNLVVSSMEMGRPDPLAAAVSAKILDAQVQRAEQRKVRLREKRPVSRSKPNAATTS